MIQFSEIGIHFMQDNLLGFAAQKRDGMGLGLRVMLKFVITKLLFHETKREPKLYVLTLPSRERREGGRGTSDPCMALGTDCST